MRRQRIPHIITLSSGKEHGDLSVSTERLVATFSHSGMLLTRESAERRRNLRIELLECSLGISQMRFTRCGGVQDRFCCPCTPPYLSKRNVEKIPESKV